MPRYRIVDPKVIIELLSNFRRGYHISHADSIYMKSNDYKELRASVCLLTEQSANSVFVPGLPMAVISSSEALLYLIQTADVLR